MVFRINRAGSIRTILLAGFVTGLLDGLAAIISFTLRGEKNPGRVFYFIASGIFGKETAYSGGVNMIITGVLLHFLIAFLFCSFFFFIYPQLKRIMHNKILIGLLYGMFIWIIMNLVVLPLSNVPPLSFILSRILTGMAILMVCVGLPAALIIDKFYAGRSDADPIMTE